MKRFVVCAACRWEDILICGARHFDKVMHSQIDALKNKPKVGTNWEQGFIDQFGVFMDRKEAMIVALEGGQSVNIARGCGGDSTTLYSEGLY